MLPKPRLTPQRDPMLGTVIAPILESRHRDLEGPGKLFKIMTVGFEWHTDRLTLMSGSGPLKLPPTCEYLDCRLREKLMGLCRTKRAWQLPAWLRDPRTYVDIDRGPDE